METEFGKRGGECPQLLDLIPSEKHWLKRDAGGGEGKDLGAAEEKKLVLRLAPPGGEGWPLVEEELDTQPSVLPSSYFSKFPKSLDKIMTVGAKRGFSDTAEPKSEGFQQQQEKVGPFQLQAIAGLGKESLREINGRMEQQQILERKVHAAPKDGALVDNTTQIRTTSIPVVGWPPIHSFRKNIASSSTKHSNEPKNGVGENKLESEISKKGFFVKINMDGIPIGRKVDLNAYDNYQKLSSAAEELFCDLLAAQRGPTTCETGMSESEKLAFTGLLDGSGEYALVYEDNEGDKMLVGDVPWDMFVSTAKRLRVLKNSELLLYLWKQQKKKNNVVLS